MTCMHYYSAIQCNFTAPQILVPHMFFLPSFGKTDLFNVSITSLQSVNHVQLFATQWTAARQDSLSITNCQIMLKLMSIESVMPYSHLILCPPLLLLPPIPPSIKVFSNESTLHMRWPKLEFQLQHHFFQRNPRADLLQNGLVESPCRPRDSQESSPTPQFKSINSSAFRFLYGLILTSIHDYWKNRSFDQTDICGLSNVSAF